MKREKKFLLICFDIALLLPSLLYWASTIENLSTDQILGSVGTWFIVCTVILFLYIFGGYDVNPSLTSRQIFARVSISVMIAMGLIVLSNYFGAKERGGIFGRQALVTSFACFAFLGSVGRVFLVSMIRRALMDSRWLFVCSDKNYPYLIDDLGKNRFPGQAYFLINNPPVKENAQSKILGSWQDLPTLFAENSAKAKLRWSGVVLALEEKAPPDVLERLILARFESVPVKDIIEFYEENWKKVPLFALGTSWFLHSQGFSLFGNPIRLRVKRLLDIVVSGGLLLFSSPLMFLTFLIIRLESAGPAIYQQIRTGRDGKDFVLFKFRSMRSDAEIAGAKWATKNDDRVTRVGKFIRKTRIDELPQLVNILKGNMSLVGPRPERPEFNELLNKEIPFYNFRHLVHPGLTGWAQILYPYGASREDAQEKLQYELFYIKNYSLWLDISIILKTVQVVLFGKGR